MAKKGLGTAELVLATTPLDIKSRQKVINGTITFMVLACFQ